MAGRCKLVCWTNESQRMWHSWWPKWEWNRFFPFSVYFCCPLLASCHQYFMLIRPLRRCTVLVIHSGVEWQKSNTLVCRSRLDWYIWGIWLWDFVIMVMNNTVTWKAVYWSAVRLSQLQEGPCSWSSHLLTPLSTGRVLQNKTLFGLTV